MKKVLTLFAVLSFAFLGTGCKETADRSSAAGNENTQKSDTTYLESQDNNGQPTSDEDGGTVSETKGAPESGYGNGNNTELQPGATGSSGSATGRADEAKK